MNGALRQVQQDRDRQTVAYYARDTVADFEIARAEAEAATAMLLGAIAPGLSLWHSRPTKAYAAKLERVYMSIVTDALTELRRVAANVPARRHGWSARRG